MNKSISEQIFKLVPIVGDFIENKISKDGGEGNVATGKMVNSVVRTILTIVITIALPILISWLSSKGIL